MASGPSSPTARNDLLLGYVRGNPGNCSSVFKLVFRMKQVSCDVCDAIYVASKVLMGTVCIAFYGCDDGRLDKPVAQRTERLRKARDSMKPLLASWPSRLSCDSYMYMYIYMCIYIYIYMYMYIYIYILCIYIYVYIYIYIRIYIYIYICMYVCMYVCMYIYVYVYADVDVDVDVYV